MAQPQHKYQTDNHRPNAWVYADAAARTAATGFTSDDLGKWAKQTDTGEFYELTATTPTWTLRTGGSGAVSSVFTRTGAVVAATGDYTATQITNTPAGNIAATNVQTALNELDTEKAAASHAHAASDITSGTIATARLGSGTADNTTFLRGDQTYAAPSGGGGGDLLAANNLSDVASAATSRTNLGLAIGTNVQAYDADLAAIAGLTSAADKGIQFTGAGTAGVYDLTAAGKALLDDADATAQRVTLGVEVPSMTAMAAAVDGKSDVFGMYDLSAAAYRKVTLSDLLGPKYSGHFFDDFLHSATSGAIVSSSSGTGAAVAISGATSADAFGVVTLTLGTTTTGRASMTSNVGIITFSGGVWYFRTRLKCDTIPDGTEDYAIRAGFIESNTGESTDAVMFRCAGAVNSGLWQIAVRNASAETVTNTAVAPSTSYQLLEIICAAGGGSAEFFIDGTSVGTVTASLPATTSRTTGFGVFALKSAGTTSRVVSADYVYVRPQFTSER